MVLIGGHQAGLFDDYLMRIGAAHRWPASMRIGGAHRWPPSMVGVAMPWRASWNRHESPRVSPRVVSIRTDTSLGESINRPGTVSLILYFY